MRKARFLLPVAFLFLCISGAAAQNAALNDGTIVEQPRNLGQVQADEIRVKRRVTDPCTIPCHHLAEKKCMVVKSTYSMVSPLQPGHPILGMPP